MLKPLAEFAKVFVGIPTRYQGAVPSEQSWPVLTVRALDDDGLNPTGIAHFAFPREPDSAYGVQTGDVLIPARSTALKVGIVPSTFAGTVINATLIGIRCLPALEPALLATFLRHSEGHAALAELSQSGTFQMNITVRALGELRVPVPPHDEQRRLVALVTAADQAHASALNAVRARRNLTTEVVVQEMHRSAVR